MTTTLIILAIFFAAFFIPFNNAYNKSRDRWKRLGFIMILFLSLNGCKSNSFAYTESTEDKILREVKQVRFQQTQQQNQRLVNNFIYKK